MAHEGVSHPDKVDELSGEGDVGVARVYKQNKVVSMAVL